MLTIQFILKRVIDFTIALLLLIPAVFFSMVIGILVKKDSPGPVFFKQKRLGKNNCPFTLYKFRTMDNNAELKRSELNAKNEADGFLFKMKRDPRETTFGRRLRNTGLDELPQLINVLKGNMSLVGPRPMPQEDIDFGKLKQKSELYHQWQIRKSVRPGITGLWQVNPGNHFFSKMLKFDEQYVERYSLWLDFKILARTILLAARGVFPKLFNNVKVLSKEDQKKEFPLKSLRD